MHFHRTCQQNLGLKCERRENDGHCIGKSCNNNPCAASLYFSGSEISLSFSTEKRKCKIGGKITSGLMKQVKNLLFYQEIEVRECLYF